jgi:hypothetical protein
MIDVQKISSTLEQLSDQGLQQYAQMHKEDPYTLAMAVSESSRRQRMRQAAQTPQQPTPGTVADEALAEMAPAAPVMPAGLGAEAPVQGFAGGGSLPQFVQDVQALPARYQQWWEDNRRKDAERATADKAAAEKRAAYLDARSKTSFANYMFGSPEREVEGLAELARMRTRYPSPAPANPNYGNEVGRTPNWGPPAAGLAAAAAPGTNAPTAPAPKAPPAPAGLADAADQVLPKAAPRAGSTPATAAPGAPTLGLDTTAMYRTAVGRNEDVTSALRTAAEQDLADAERLQQERGVLGAGREARIKEQQEGMAGREAQAKRDALLQAGFAILAADPRRGAWSAIGTGALQGLQGYKGDMADITKQREALLGKLDEIDDLRRQEAAADGKERLALKSRIRQVAVEGAKLNADIGNKLDLEVTPKIAMSVFEQQSATYRSERENATRMAAARVSAAAGSRNQQLELAQAYAKSAGIPLDRAIQEISQGKREPVNVMAGYNDWAKAHPTLAMGDPTQAVAAYLATSGALKAATQAVKVTDRPTGPLLAR